MKKVMVIGVMWVMLGMETLAQSKVDEQRMEQDIMVAENILGTLMKQQTGKRNFFPMEIRGSYAPGYGVTFRLPHSGLFNKMMIGAWDTPATVDIDMNGNTTYGYSWSYSEDGKERTTASPEKAAAQQRNKAPKARTKIAMAGVPPEPGPGTDSAAMAMNARFLEVAKSFLADYGDILSQLKPNERIVITNRAGGFDGDLEFRFPGMEPSPRSVVSAEAMKEDITQFKQGKITRNQFIAKLKIVNTQLSDELDPDLEVLSSLMSRLYREDLSKTYFIQGEVNYERMKDFGAVYYMTVYSSYQQGEMFILPGASMQNADQKERDDKVKELYPVFEADLKNNIVEYGRTLRSLGDEEVLVFNVRLTRCNGCGIPASIEMSIKNSALKDYSLGKATKEATVGKVTVKKNGVQ